MQAGALKNYELYQVYVGNGWGFLKHNVFQTSERIQNSNSSYLFQCGKFHTDFDGAESNKVQASGM